MNAVHIEQERQISFIILLFDSHLKHVLCARQNVDVVAPSVSVDFPRQLYKIT
jgi:hypothetical protein